MGETRPDPLLNRTIGGKYRVVECIGGGGFGRVYRAEHQPVGRIVALKVINEAVQNESELRQRFLREARSVALLKSTYVVPLFDFGEDEDGLLYMVFEFIDGRTLKDILIAEGALALNEAVRYSIEILEGLSEAHENGIIHRDLKPANIMITPGAWGKDQARILDFGVAKMLDTERMDALELTTQQGIVLGTPHYMSPEQARNRGVDRRADIYALGTLLYTMVAGRPPFLADSIFEVIKKQIDEPVHIPLERLSAPTGFLNILGKAMAKDPDQRYQNARDMAEALAPYAHHRGEDEVGTHDTAPEIDPLAIQSRPLRNRGTEHESQTRLPSRRLRYAPWLIVLTLIGLGGAIWWVMKNPTPPSTTPGAAISESTDEKNTDTGVDVHATVDEDHRKRSSQKRNVIDEREKENRQVVNPNTQGRAEVNGEEPASDRNTLDKRQQGIRKTIGEPPAKNRYDQTRPKGAPRERTRPRSRSNRTTDPSSARDKKSSKEALTVPEF